MEINNYIDINYSEKLRISESNFAVASNLSYQHLPSYKTMKMENIIYSMPFEEFKSVLKKCIREEINTPKVEPVKEELLKTEDAVKLFGVSKVTLHKWRKSGILPFHRIASRIYFKKSELIDALNASPRSRRGMLKK